MKNDRLRVVLEKAAKEFGWADRRRPTAGAANDRAVWALDWRAERRRAPTWRPAPKWRSIATSATIEVRRVCQAFDCGAVVNPGNLVAQNQGAIVMGLGGALMEEVRFHDGTVTNPHFASYPVPRFKDVPRIDIHLVNRPDLPSAGAGETPIVGIAPAVANAVFHATGVRVRAMPLRDQALKKA